MRAFGNFIRASIFFIFKTVLVIVAIVILLLGISSIYARVMLETKNAVLTAPAETKFMSLNDRDVIAYQEIDNNATTTIVFVGGLSGWSGTWQRTMKELDKNLHGDMASSSLGSYNLLAIDLPPFGYSSSDPVRGYWRNEQADRIKGFLRNKDIDNAIFVAHSYGAGPVTEAIMTGAKRVQKLIIVDGVLNIDEKDPDDLHIAKDKSILLDSRFVTFLILGVSHSKALVQNRLESFVYKKDHIDNDLIALYMQAFRLKGNGERLAHWVIGYMTDPLNHMSNKGSSYAALPMPVRIIWGDRDTLTPPAEAEKLNSVLLYPKLYMLKDVGHIPMIEDYEQFDAVLLKAISE